VLHRDRDTPGYKTEQADCLRFRDWNHTHLGLAVSSGREWSLLEY